VGDLKNEQELKAFGATEVFSYRSETLADDIIAANGGPIDAVLDVVGDALFDMSLQVLKKGGKFCISGSAGGQTTHLDFRT
ncbi:zinc-binding dehydrogenase, partial [Brevibacillus sp. SIMBA_076]|uniref:zinc-binding dehydrogenase n=1 Tax=Brevibacillus sp. SIMBA_076 TaxID=3085814 RepID=UPI0039799741